jgi:hypothetical protein
MFVHSAQVQLRLPSSSLKGKRGIVKGLLARARNRFNVSAAEVDLQDLPGSAMLGFVIVTEGRSDGRHLMDRLEDWIVEEHPDIEVVAVDIEER